MATDGPDPAGRGRLRRAAFELFSERGVEPVSVRAIAERAGVTAGLVTHHFGAKEGLISEVDAYALEQCSSILEAALASLDLGDLPVGEWPIGRVQGTIYDAMRDQPVLREYIARRIASDADAGHQFFQQFVVLVEAGLRRLRSVGAVRPEVDAVGAMVFVVHLILGPILLARQWSHVAGVDSFDGIVLEPATRASEQILQRGLFGADRSEP